MSPPAEPAEPAEPAAPTAEETAAELQSSLGVLYRRIRQTKALGDLTLPESSALSQLRHGPRTSAALAKLEQITPQSMGTTMAGLEQKGLVQRTPDATDGRRQLLSLTAAGRETVMAGRSRRTRQLTAALEQFSPAEREQLLGAIPLLDKLAERL